MAASTKINELIEQFQNGHEGSPWYGNSHQDILEGVDATLAFWEPRPGAHSIAQIIWHIVYWRQSLIKRLAGDTHYKGSMKSDDNWSTLERLKQAGWDSLKMKFITSQQEMLALLQKEDDSILKQAYKDKVTFHDLIIGIQQHDIYHMGQVAYLKSIYSK